MQCWHTRMRCTMPLSWTLWLVLLTSVPCALSSCSEYPCPDSDAYHPHTFVPDRRPVLALQPWNGCFEGKCGLDGNKFGFASWWRPDLNPPQAVGNLVGALQDGYDQGFRRFVAWLPAGSLEDQCMSSAQWWPLSDAARAELNTTLRSWLTEHPDSQFGPYVGFDVSHGNSPCTLNMSNHVDPEMTNDTDRCILHKTAAPWADIGAKLIWYDASSGNNGSNLIEMYHNRSYDQLSMGGEAVPADQHLPPGVNNSDRCAHAQALGHDITYGDSCSYYLPKPTPSHAVPWISNYMYLTCRNWGSWPVWNSLASEIGVLLSGHTPCSLCLSDMMVNGTRISQNGTCPYAAVGFDTAVALHNRGWVLWPTNSTSGATMEAAKRLNNFGTIACGGDFNYDGVVNDSDKVAFRTRWQAWEGRTTDPANGTLAFWHGDVNDDGCVNGADLSLFETSIWSSNGVCHPVKFKQSRPRPPCTIG
eukprot:m.56583 g.56583  ORF g.56583 m.56583 type:complete len:474 (+) comp15585_c0_seq1:263-1684(+)